MDSVITEYPTKEVTDTVADEIDALLTAVEVHSGRVKPPISTLLSHIETIEWLREIGVSGDFTISF